MSTICTFPIISNVLNRTVHHLHGSLYPIIKTFAFFSTDSSDDCPEPKSLKDAICEKIPCAEERITEFRKKHGNKKIGDITVNMLYGGMRGMTGLICETSDVCPNNGVRFRGRTIEDCLSLLPTAVENGQPLPESLFWLLCTGDIPTVDEVSRLSHEWTSRAKLPNHTVLMLNSMPKTLHPMAQLSAAVISLSHDSHFAKAYAEGMKKSQYWEMVYEDAMDLIGKLIVVCAMIYTNTFKCGKGNRKVCPNMDWTGNFCNMMGFTDQNFAEMMRLYLVLHSDHEGGNVSAHGVSLVGSALADPYMAYAAGMNGLAGPLHGLANQEVLKWMMKMQEDLGKEPSDDQIKDYVKKSLDSGKVVPGFGHAVLRSTDPRYTAFHDFAKKTKPDNDLVKLTGKMFNIVPPLLKATGKVKNPMPNVDGSSGALLTAFGMTEMSYYTVLFALSRSLGTMAQLIWARALGFPIERPKSIPTKALIDLVEKKDAPAPAAGAKKSTPAPKKK